MTDPSPSPKTPEIKRHKASGRAYCIIDGRFHYFGKHGTAAATAAYGRLIAEWAAFGYRLPVPQDEITMAEVAADYLGYARRHYCNPSTGKITSPYAESRAALKAVLKLYADVPAVQFGPVALRAVRKVWIDQGLSISTINSYAGRLRLMAQWAASHEMVPESMYRGLCTLRALERGRGVGKDPVSRVPVPLKDVEDTIPHLSRPLQAVVRLLLLTGARPSEILTLRCGDIDQAADPINGVWVAEIRDHKTKHHGKPRYLSFGPQAQAVLKPFLLRPDVAYLFSPTDAEKERHRKQAEHTVGRRKNQKPNPRKTARKVGDLYTYRNLGVAIQRVCEKHDLPKWTPYQIRHLFATTAEARTTWDTTQALMGHSDVDMTRAYVHKGREAIIAYAAEFG